MPLHGKIVVIKRNGGDGTEFPLTTSCLFGRMPDCDIRIQLPQVSKEHCRIDLNENKEVILTNLSSVNPTRVNGEVLQQSERLKHGDVITVIDRSFRFEYPPAPTPKKRSSTGGKAETLKVRQDQQVGDTLIVEAGEKRTSEVSTDPHLKDGANHDNIQRSLEKTMDIESKEGSSALQNKTTSPFSDLYQMIKKSLDVKTPWKSSASQPQTPSSKLCTPRPGSVRKSVGKPVSTEVKSTPKKNEVKDFTGAETPKSVKKQRKSLQGPSVVMARSEAENVTKLEATSTQGKPSTPQKFTVNEVIEQISNQTPKSPMRRRSKEAMAAKAASTGEEQAAQLTKASPSNSGKAEKVSKKRKSGELGDLSASLMKKKRVSFGGYLTPELFDKRLPPDSPLRKGATPRRSLSLLKPKQSLLRRASAIGLVKPASPKTPKSSSSSPKSKSPSPAKKTPKSKSPSPAKKTPKSKSPSPAKKTPKSKSPSPAKKTPKSKSPSPAKKTPKSKSASPTEKSPKSKSPSPAKGRSPAKKVQTPKANEQPKTPGQEAHKEIPTGKRSPASEKNTPSIAATPAKTPLDSGVQTPTVQGRFSVSRISTPSPTAEIDATAGQVPLLTVTPKIPLKRKSMKSASRKTPSVAKSVVKVMQRRSGVSRASMKVLNSWADIVKFGKTKAEVVPAKKVAAKTTTKKTVSKPQTPARKFKSHMSTGHADSPMTIVVGRAHKRMVVHPPGAAPRVVTNTAVLKKNMKMDEDLTGISEMFKTPVNERKRRSTMIENSASKSPADRLGTSVIEPSVLNTPEETGEMMVSPLSVASAVKGRKYSSEAVQRLLNAEPECSFVSDSDTPSEPSEQQGATLKAATVTTPKQKPQIPECLTGVKRIMKTPRQKVEPVEDLRGKILKTPKQKCQQQECLTGVKRIMKTPRQKTEPVEDLRGRILKTPKQKTEEKECLTGVKRIMKTPRRMGEPLEDIRGKLLVTPKQKPEQQECLTGVKRIFETPKQMDEPSEDIQDKHLMTPRAPEADMSMNDIQELLVTPARMQESEMAEKSSPTVSLSGIKRIMKTPKEKSAPVEDMVGIKRLLRTPRQKGEPVEKNFGIKRLMKSPRLRGNAPVEDFEGLQELMEEPVPDSTKQDECQMSVDSAEGVVPLEQSKDGVDENLSEVDTANGKVPETHMHAADPGQEKKLVRGRKTKAVQSKAAQDKSEESAIPAPARGRRGKKAEAAPPPAVRHTTRGRAAKTTVSKDLELAKEESTPQPSNVSLKPRRGRNAKKVSDVETEGPKEVVPETDMMLEPESEQSPANDGAASAEKVVLQPERGRRRKAEQQEVYTEDLPQADMAQDANEISDQLEELPGGRSETKPPDATETVPQVPEIESVPDVEPEMRPAVVQKKPARGRKGKVMASKEVEDKSETAEEPVASAPVRGRRGMKTEGTVPPAPRQTKTRNAKEASKQPTVETQLAEISTETISEQTSDSKPPTEEAVVKPVRGRKAKQTPDEQTQTEPEKGKETNTQPEQPTVANPRRGRKARADAIEQNDVAAEDAGVPVESNNHSQPPARARRGRNAKEEEHIDNVESVEPQQPVKKVRRTRKAEQEHVELTEEVKPIEMAVPEEAETKLIQPVMVNEQNAVAAKPKRGGRKIKQDTKIVVPVESTEVPTVNITDKPRRGRKAKQLIEEVQVTAENPEQELEAEEVKTVEPIAVALKPSKARGAKTVRKEIPQAVPAKRAHQGTSVSLEDTNVESTVQVSESEPEKPAKRGRRAAVAKPSTEEASEQEKPSDTKRSVKWNMDVKVFEVPKTPVKAVRGRRKTKLADDVDAESKNVSKDSNKTEEEDLSGKAVEAPPLKRTRRNATADKAEATSRAEDIAAETQPKTRRGRPVKK